MFTGLTLWLAGFWPAFWHLGVGAVLFVLFGFLAIYFRSLGFFYAALAVLLALGFEAYGVHIEKAARDAQGQIITQDVDKGVAHTQTPSAKAKKDPWDKPTY